MTRNRRRTGTAWRASAATIGAVVLAAVGAAANAEETEGDVDVRVDIAEVDQPGALTLRIDGTSAVLAEGEGTAETRLFTGALPTVTVSDTRDAEDVQEGTAWAVLGSASDFTGDAGQPAIPSSHLGWTPALVGEADAGGLVFVGEPVEGELDGGGPGLVDRELLVSSADSPGSAAAEGSWSADAVLDLRVPAAVAPGAYSSTLTLSLFE